MNRKTRLWHHDQEDDPLGGLVNLFDLWIVVVVALILVLVRSTERISEMTSKVKDSQVSPESLIPMVKYMETASELSGKGTRLGTAYRLQTGEIVYSPDEK
jgi:hypothetical protein